MIFIKGILVTQHKAGRECAIGPVDYVIVHLAPGHSVQYGYVGGPGSPREPVT